MYNRMKLKKTNVLKKIRKSLFEYVDCRRMVATNRGMISPQMPSRLYELLERPIVTYGWLVWWEAIVTY